MTEELEKLSSLLEKTLVNSAPVLSGNTQSHISIVDVKENEVTICVEAQYYDLDKWKKDKVIVFTSPNNYANFVNLYGGFGRGNDSMYWANRACYEVCEIIANEIGGILKNDLPL